MEYYNMSKKELDQIELFGLLKRGKLTQAKVAELCALSVRQVGRKLKRFVELGARGLKHALRGDPGNRGIKKELADDIVKLFEEIYRDYGPTLFAEKLEERHGIKIDHETVRRLLIKRGVYEPNRKKSVRRSRREPKHHCGEMVQLDGSEHIWFGNDYSTLIVFIDDATKETFARFAPESTQGVAETYRLFLKKYGRPMKIYCDRGKVFKVNNSKNNATHTQFKRMNDELEVELSYALSPQAKGRVERVNRTLQDRLVKELKLRSITTIDQANAILDEFLSSFNEKFKVRPKNNASLYRSIDGYNLNYILCYKYQRKLNNDYTISYKNRCIQLIARKQQVMTYPHDTIDVYEAFDSTISLWKKGN